MHAYDVYGECALLTSHKRNVKNYLTKVDCFLPTDVKITHFHINRRGCPPPQHIFRGPL
jgi:hypothetical protein